MSKPLPYPLPETITFKEAFKAVLRVVIMNNYGNLDVCDPEDQDPESYRTDLSNAISETLEAMDYEAPDQDDLDWLGDLYDLAAEEGYVPPDNIH